jgi:hypothetical protein
MRRGRIYFGGMAILIGLVLSVPAAFAAGGGPATNQGYPKATKPPAAAGVAGASKSATGSVKSARAGGTLPFTGMQLGMVVLVGLFLVGGGVVLRRSGRSGTSI